MGKRSKAQRAAEARYEKGGRVRNQVCGRLTPEQSAWLDERRSPEEGQFPALKRLAGMPGTDGLVN